MKPNKEAPDHKQNLQQSQRAETSNSHSTSSHHSSRHQAIGKSSQEYKAIKWSRSDVREIAAGPKSQENELLLKLGMTSLAKKNITEALNLLNEIDRPDLIQTVLLQGNQSNFSAAKSWVSNMEINNGDKQYHMLSLFRGLASSDPQLALEYSQQITSAQHKEQVSAVIVNEWAATDPKLVFDWLANQEFSSTTERSYITAMRHEIARSPQDYTELLGHISEGAIKNELSNFMGQHLALHDPAEAITWMNQLDKSAQREALNGIIDGWSQTANDASIFDYLESHRDEAYHEDVFRIAAVNIAYENPEKLLERFDDMTKSEKLVSAEHLAISLSMNDLPQAKSWVNDLETGYIKDLSIVKLTNQIKTSEPAYSFNLALDIKNAGDRVGVLKSIIENMGSSDPQAAYHLLNQANQLSPMERNELEAALQNAPLASDIILPSK